MKRLTDVLVHLMAIAITAMIIVGACSGALFLALALSFGTLSLMNHVAFDLTAICKLTIDSLPTIATVSLLILITILIDNRE